ncbi:hypothetical protein LJR219_001668 [Phenylobacterium sp. LjRoot219]|uniref:hypothetical protein n=1 Tax=Phenylobacterium sp. LjRoot219 TaxID=3342283 RepID=UPI003ECDD4CB
MVIGIDSTLLLGYYQAKSGLGTSSAATGTGAVTNKVAPTPPWQAQLTPKQVSASVTAALAGRKIIDENAAQLDLAGAGSDYRKLFALYQGIGTLSELANQIKEPGVNSGEKSRLQQVFAKGMTELQNYVGSADLEKLRLAFGDVTASEKAKLTVAKAPDKYVTAPIATSTSEPVPAFEGDVKFNIQVTRLKETFDVAIDLSTMPDQTRSLPNVINYINDQLKAAGVDTRFGTDRIPGEPKQIKAGAQTITLPAGPDQWALKVTVGLAEEVTFSSPQSAGAVYLAQEIGDADPDRNSKTNDGTIQQQLLKFQTDTDALDAPPQASGQANWVDGRVFAKNLDSKITAVRAQAMGPDGSVYMLADVGGTVNGQTIKGADDVALLKYDAAGNLIYTRTLGAVSEATGLALAVSDDGKVAIAGSVKGELEGATEGALNSGTTGGFAGLTDSFVTLFDEDGQELWTQRRGARQDDQVNQLAFGADGTVYVAGQAKSAMPGGGGALGDWDGYVEAFATDEQDKVTTLFTQTFGGEGGDKPKGLVVDGTNVVVASVENGRAVLRRFDVSGETPVELASRDLGDLEGGDIEGLALDANGQLVLVGTTSNPQLSVDTVTNPAAGGQDVFAARIAKDLSVSANDRLAYYGGAGDDRATAMGVADGEVWIAGISKSDLPDQAPVGKQDGFLTKLDINTGAVAWSRRFTGVSDRAAPSAIAVAPQGASVLDRLGLPTGKLSLDGTEQITAVSAVRPGDQFTVKSGGLTKTVTIEADDTLDNLALKIRRASGFAAKVTVSTNVEGQRTLKIEPASNTAVIEIGAGKGDTNALLQLGIAEGVVRNTKSDKDGKSISADGKPNIYGLGLHTGINLSDTDQISHALAELAAAQDAIRQAYKDLVAAATPKSAQNAAAAAAAAGKAPAYMTNQISNYQAALDRLTAGSSSGSTTAGLFGL